MTEQSRWYAPAPSDIQGSRLTLDLGLRSADLFFRERTVPGLGRVWFVRQLSWPVAAIALHARLVEAGERRYRPSSLCHGIEALGCKLEHVQGADSDRVLGTRAFGRDEDLAVWQFARLSRPASYVRNTHRQAATRALRVDDGLGLATGARFDAMQLTPVGVELARAFLGQKVGQGGTTLENWLLGWVREKKEIPQNPATLVKALSPHTPTADESLRVRSRLLDVDGEACATRIRLARALGTARSFPDVESTVVPRLRKAGASVQARDVLAARAFGELIDTARDVVVRLTQLVAPARDGVAIVTLAKDARVAERLIALRGAASRFRARAREARLTEPDSARFAAAQDGATPEAALRHLVTKSGEVLALSGSSVIRGRRFKAIPEDGDAAAGGAELGDGATSLEPDSRTERSFRMANLHALLADIREATA